MIIVLGSVTIQPGRVTEALALSHEHVRRSRAEPGCLMHAVHIDAENPERLVFVEQWQNHRALQAHFKVPESWGFVRALGDLAVEPPSLQVFNATARPG